MEQNPVAAAAPRYRAFVSYSHADAAFATWLHRKLEAAPLPDGQRLAPIFIDRAELVAAPDLSAQVREALADSAALLVISSPAAKASRWVGQEIALFRELHPDRPVLAALAAGEPDEAFPEALLSHRGTAIEPLAADFRKGQDGKRLGLLKIVAGLSGQPLDRLVQRDAQARQRRVMAVTAATAILSLILAGLLVLALRARAEAERQRTEAEGLVEFMLTDLRDKLKGVGRLDVMDSVNERVMQRYSHQDNLSAVAPDTLIRRAKLLQAMAEDDFSSEGRNLQGRQEAIEAARITAHLVSRHPNDANVLSSHAKSQYWLGYSFFVEKGLPPAHRRALVSRYWSSNRDFSNRALAQDPERIDLQLEASYSEGNLCALELSKPARPKNALAHCRRATELLEQAFLRQPENVELALNLSSSYAWGADAASANRQLTQALQLRRSQLDLAIRLTRSHPNDRRVDEAHFLARFGLAKQLRASGYSKTAQIEALAARSIITNLQRSDPQNGDWASWLGQIDAFLNENDIIPRKDQS